MGTTDNMKKPHVWDNKYDEEKANKLASLDNKIHFKLYKFWANRPCLTLSEIAGVMGVSRAQVQKYMREEKPETPADLNLLKLSIHYSIPLHYWLYNSVDAMDDPTQCVTPGNYVEIVNENCIPSAITSHLNIETKEQKEKHRAFLLTCGLTPDLLYRLNDEGAMELALRIQQEIKTVLSNPNNRYSPANPVDADWIEDCYANIEL